MCEIDGCDNGTRWIIISRDRRVKCVCEKCRDELVAVFDFFLVGAY